MKVYSEKTFEAHIEDTMFEKGWLQGNKDLWDKKYALFPHYITSFIKDTQPQLWQELEKTHSHTLTDKIIDTLIKERNLKNTLVILRKGFKFEGKEIKLAYFKPANQLVDETQALYLKNTLHITRQIPCHPSDTSTIDILLSINGIPVATIEIKNPATHQTWRDAVEQYKSDRDPNAPLFKFKNGAIVHFAVDPDEIYMTTELKRGDTRFLPFNRGSNPGEIDCGKGNPQHSSGHRTAYLWEEILERDSFMDIICNYIFVEKRESITEGKQKIRIKTIKESVVFPRYHQLDSVRKTIHTAQIEGPGYDYLIQHSAGSGKTNSISWLAHRLSCIHSSTDDKVFDSVIVITDRTILDKQLQEAVTQIETKRGVVQPIDKNSTQLAKALLDRIPIVVTTLQKFPFIMKQLFHIAGSDDCNEPDEKEIKKVKEWKKEIASRKYAIIIDEAHSSQTGETAHELKLNLGDASIREQDPQLPDYEDNINKIMETRKKQKNLSFFAFTATPKGKTLEIFGRPGIMGKKMPFHSYSMKQAIEEGFILDVLHNYTTYKTFYELVKTTADDPDLPEKAATKKLVQFLNYHEHNLRERSGIIIEHFKENVRYQLEGRAKGMVVTGSRLHAVLYMNSIKKYIEEQGYTDIRPLVAFSGTVKDPETGTEYTEPSMNIDIITKKPISESGLAERFNSSDYHLLIAADKYQTGFDQPLLCAMYVDKRLDGVQAVQTLSRLNRNYPGKKFPFVLDFVNDEIGILEAFTPYYTITTLEKSSDPHLLEQLYVELNNMDIIDRSDLEAFVQVLYKSEYNHTPKDHARLESYLQSAIINFNQLEDQEKRKFYDKITAFVRFYVFITQVIPYSDKDHEMFYAYGTYLIPRLRIGDDFINPHPEKDVALVNYKIQPQTSGLSIGETEPPYGGVYPPTAVGTGKAEEKEKPLSEIIKKLNEQFGTEFNEKHQVIFDRIEKNATKNQDIIRIALDNSMDKFELGIKNLLEDIIAIQMDAYNDEINLDYMADDAFKKVIFKIMAVEIYKKIRSTYT